MHETKKSYGKLNPDKTFFVIRLYPPAAGFLSNYVYVLGYMKYAIDQGWIPVVDMENYQTMYTDPELCDQFGISKNVWEWFFEQPLDVKSGKRYSLQEVYHSKNVILSNGNMDLHDESLEETALSWQREMAKLVPFNAVTLSYINGAEDRVIGKNGIDFKEMLGIPVRGTDLQKRVIHHSIQLTSDDAPQYIARFIEKWKLKKVFVNCESANVMENLEREIPNICYYDCKRISNNKGGQVAYNLADNAYFALRDYIVNTIFLSRCGGLIGTMNNGFLVAYIWSEGTAKRQCIDLGRFK